MEGIVLNLLRDTMYQQHDAVEKYPNLLWTYYDHLHIKKIDKFENFFLTDGIRKDWDGGIQSLYLYPLQFDRENKI